MLNIVYNNKACACEGSSQHRANRTANRIRNYFSRKGTDVNLYPYKEGMEVDLLERYGVDFFSGENEGELCWLVVFDDENKGRFISFDSTETEAVSMEDIRGMFKSRQERRLERQYMLARAEGIVLEVAEKW